MDNEVTRSNSSEVVVLLETAVLEETDELLSISDSDTVDEDGGRLTSFDSVFSS